jgi:hypothetical protein
LLTPPTTLIDELSLVQGEAVLDADGVLHGWCWSPALPRERQIVEVLVNDRIAAEILATRFRDDLGTRGVGDGYHGFVIPLTKSIAQAGAGCVVSVRHQATGGIFWRSVVGQIGLPTGLAARTARVEAVCKLVSWRDREAYGRPAKVEFAARLGALGRYLARGPRLGRPFETPAQARTALSSDGEMTRLIFMAEPAISVILDAGHDARATLRVIASAAACLHVLRAELIILDTGADARHTLLPSLCANLRYVASQGVQHAISRREAAMVARAPMLVFLENRGADFSAGLLELASAAWDRQKIAIPAMVADKVRRFDPRIAESVGYYPASSRSGLRLGVAREHFLKWGHDAPGETVMAMRALREGHAVIGWREPCNP